MILKNSTEASINFQCDNNELDNYDNDKDYETPYHWYMLPDDLLGGGMDYWQYVKIVARILHPLPKNSILEVGCGDGRVAEYIAEEYPGTSVLGIDISSRAIAFARLMGRHAQFHHRNVFDINASYDVVLLVEVLEHLPKETLPKFLSKLRSLLNPGGSLVLSVPTILVPMLHPGHVQHFTVDSLAKELSRADFSIVDLQYHLDVRMSRYSLGWRALLKFCDNRIYTIKPLLRLLGTLHQTYSMHPTDKYAGRIIARATVNIT